MILRGALVASGLTAGSFINCAAVIHPEPFEVVAAVETEPVPSSDDAADDMCIWVHPTDRSLCTVIATDKDSGLVVYDLEGKMIHYYKGGEPNNVDIRHGVDLGGSPVDIVAAGDRATNTIVVYRVVHESRGLISAAARPITTGIGIYGFCLYRDAKNGTLFAFVNSNQGQIEQWELFDDGSGQLDGRLARSMAVGSQTEGCVADDELGRFYIAEEAVGIWRFPADPTAGVAGVRVDGVIPEGRLVPDVEGLTLYLGSGGTGYLIASSQSDSGNPDMPPNSYLVYRRDGDNEFVTSFRIVDGETIDGVTATDGIDVASCDLGPRFPQGVFIAQDDENPGANQNFKLVSWAEIAGQTKPTLSVDPDWDPRK
jgi:3-phytase